MASSSNRPLPLTGDDEDAFSRTARRSLCCLDRAGVITKTKRRYRHRERQYVRAALRRGDQP